MEKFNAIFNATPKKSYKKRSENTKKVRIKKSYKVLFKALYKKI